MNLNPDVCYQAILSSDARFDGIFFVGVSTTGIYCRPVCPARTPRRENCTFYPSAAAAEQAGFRPCLRCRPELAPGNARIDAVSHLAAIAASRIEDGALTDRSVEDLAGELGISGRHLRRVVESEFGVSPIQLAQTQRLLFAKRLLTDTNLPVIEVAYASGFSSLRRFNALFKEQYRLNPTSLRKARESRLPQRTLTCELAYREPFDWDAMLGFLAARTARNVEAVLGRRYLRTVALGRQRGWIVAEPSPNKNTIRVELSSSLALVVLPVLTRVKRLFDLAAAPRYISDHLGPLADAHPGLRVPGAFDGFEIAVRAVLGQRISVKAATTLMGRFVEAFGEPVETPFDQLTLLTPTSQAVAKAEPEELTSLGIGRAQACAIVALARAVAEGEITLEPGAGVEDTMARLTALPGVGDWTAQYIAMRALSWPDAFPHGDLGIRKALGESSQERVLRAAEAWRPWRAYAAMHLWKSLDNGR